jgi:HD-GYP domain-containing protein (c-di-GMP phosphodiesterase class II)
MAMVTEVAWMLGLDQEEARIVGLGGLLHDVGKLCVPVSILNKPAKLSTQEMQVVRLHVRAGAELLKPHAELAPVAPLVLHSHERWDGDGYPDGLKGTDIPLGSRIISVVDAFCAMTEDRSYSEALLPAEGIDELIRCSGTQFDSMVVRVFISSLKQHDQAIVQAI